MARIVDRKIFDCNESMCWEGHARDSVIGPGDTAGEMIGSVPVSLVVTNIWLIRPSIELLNGYTEASVVEVSRRRGIEAMWVDSESDARAMAGEV